MKNISFKNFWFSPFLPEEHMRIKKEDASIRKYIMFWFIHPIKRRLAKYYLTLLRSLFGLKVIAITGSAGKTSTKEMLASILKFDGSTVYSYKNIDPVYNIPSTIFKCSLFTRYLVLEMGVEYPGEMEFYLWMVKPDIAIVTNVYPTHTEFFKNVEGVYKEKSKLVSNLTKSNIAVLNKENKFTKKMADDTSAKVVWFGEKSKVYATNIKNDNSGIFFTLATKQGKRSIHLALPGKQFVKNALAASSAALELSISMQKIKKGLESFELPEHRMDIIVHKSGAIILDDTYNNNPEAAKEAIGTLFDIVGKKKAGIVMGDMLELGDHEKEEHIKVGRLIGKSGADFFVGVGETSKYSVNEARKYLDKVYWAKDYKAAEKYLAKYLRDGFVILIKGSRSIGLEKLIELIL